ncbi:MAG: hypothetical protein KDC45_11565, partial [Bacteroidetes bacterium]|nr:hypothetical protein [Bacteroidota bacterium]
MKRTKQLNTFLWCVLFLSGSIPVLAQENSDCFDCHDDITLEAQRNGRTVSLNVSPKRFAAAAHRNVKCVGCHAELAGQELPHEEFQSKAQCKSCHEA